MRKLLIVSACFAIGVFAAVEGQAADSKPAKHEKAMAIPANIKAAVDNPSRPKADTDVDQFRKPAETMAFAGIKPGMTVLELLPGGGYYTRLLEKAVQPGGHVYAYSTPPRGGRGGPPPTPAAKTIADASGGMVSYIEGPMTSPSASAPVDLVWTSRNYHDENAATRASMNQAVFDALKPGGTYFILDHSAVVGTGDFAMNQPGGPSQALHRIDENLVKLEVIKAGFELVGESDILRNPKDTRLTRVFDSSIRGDTDQFVLKFRKPGKSSKK